MFRSAIFYENFTESMVGPWRLYLLIGASLMAAALLIFIFPELLAYLIAGFLLLNGVFFFSLALKLRKLGQNYRHWVSEYWEP